jgi:hypothetical protein
MHHHRSPTDRANRTRAGQRVVARFSIVRRAAELLKDVKPPRDRFAAIKTVAAGDSDPDGMPDA